MSTLKNVARSLVFAPLHPDVLRPMLFLARACGFLPALSRTSVVVPRRILVVNLTTFLGDGVMMMPFLEKLRSTYPDASIDLVVGSSLGPLFYAIPSFVTVRCLPSVTSSVFVWSVYRRMLQMLALARTLPRGQAFDACFLPRWGTDPGLSAWFALFAGAAHIQGHDPREDAYGHASVPGARRILTTIVTGGYHLQEAMRELLLLGATSHIDYQTETKAIVRTLKRLSQTVDGTCTLERFGIDSSSFIAFSPGASSPARRWPIERFGSLARHLYALTGMKCILVGGLSDSYLGTAIWQEAPDAVLNLIGLTSLPELVYLLGEAALLVANDSGPAHIGGGIGTPTLVLSACPIGSTIEHASSPVRVAPVGPTIRVLQPVAQGAFCSDGCMHEQPHCILGLSVDSVFSSCCILLPSVD